MVCRLPGMEPSWSLEDELSPELHRPGAAGSTVAADDAKARASKRCARSSEPWRIRGVLHFQPKLAMHPLIHRELLAHRHVGAADSRRAIVHGARRRSDRIVCRPRESGHVKVV